MKLFLWVHPGYYDYVKQGIAWWCHRIDALLASGCVLVLGDELISLEPAPGDSVFLIGRLSAAQARALKKFEPERRWHFVNDEGCDNAGRCAYDRALAYMRELEIKGIVLTYPNVERVARIEGEGVKVIVSPHCVPNVRAKTAKAHDVIAVGQFSSAVYPTRTRLKGTLAPRTYAPPAIVFGEGYSAMLDGVRLGIVCRAGLRDRFVSKYVEFGASHVLPVGDCPTYMPEDMKRAMIDVSGMDDASIRAEVERLLSSPVELDQRTDEFASIVARDFLALPNAVRIVRAITDV